jgi:heterogeneous nuclear ribonucleoprotein F/H
LKRPSHLARSDAGVGAVRVFDQQLIHIKPEWHRADLPTFQYAPSLLQCVRKFDAYAYAQFTQKNKSFCFVTDGPGDLMFSLRKECLLKGIRLAAYFDRFFDLNREFSKFYPEYNGKTLADMAQIVGVPRKPESSGIENCKIISNIIASVLREGYSFVEPETVPIAFDPFAIPLHHGLMGGPEVSLGTPVVAVAAAPVPAPAVVVAKVPLSYKGVAAGQQRVSGPSSPAVATPEADGEVPADSPVVRLRGLPWDATDAQVIEFFTGLRVVNVVWTFTHRNRPSGEAFVTFATVGEAVKGLAMHKQMLGKRYIEVFASTAAQAEAAQLQGSRKDSSGNSPRGTPPVATPSPAVGGGTSSAGPRREKESERGNSNNSNGNGTGGGETFVMMFGLPYTVTVYEIEEFFEGYNLVPGSVEIDTDASGRAIGTGQVNFYKAKDATRAVAELNKQFIGTRYVNLHQNPQKRRQQQQQLLGQK